MGNIPYFHELHRFYGFLFTVISKHKIRVRKRFFLTFLQLRVRNLLSSSEGTKPVHGVSLEVSSFPQRRKSGSQIIYPFLMRQSDVRTPKRIFATAAPQDNCYSEPDWAGSPACASGIFQRAMALGCDRLWVCEYHSATSSTDLFQVCVQCFHPNRGIAEHSMLLHISVSLQWEKKTQKLGQRVGWDSPQQTGRMHPGSAFQPRQNACGPQSSEAASEIGRALHSLIPVEVCTVHRTGWGATEGIDVFRNWFSCITAYTNYIYVQKWFPSPRNLYLHWKPQQQFYSTDNYLLQLSWRNEEYYNQVKTQTDRWSHQPRSVSQVTRRHTVYSAKSPGHFEG